MSGSNASDIFSLDQSHLRFGYEKRTQVLAHLGSCKKYLDEQVSHFAAGKADCYFHSSLHPE